MIDTSASLNTCISWAVNDLVLHLKMYSVHKVTTIIASYEDSCPFLWTWDCVPDGLNKWWFIWSWSGLCGGCYRTSECSCLSAWTLWAAVWGWALSCNTTHCDNCSQHFFQITSFCLSHHAVSDCNVLCYHYNPFQIMLKDWSLRIPEKCEH